MIDGATGYRVRGRRGTTAYLGFQVLAGDRPHAAAHGRPTSPTATSPLGADGDVRVRARRRTEPSADELGGDRWVAIPDDASAIVVREYIADRVDRGARRPRHRAARPARPLAPPTDDAAVAEQLTAMAWTIAKLDDAAPHDQARAARPAQPARHRRGRRPRRGRHHARQPLHDRHLPPRPRRGARHRPRATRHRATGASRSRTSGTSASTPAAGAARSPTPPRSPTPTAWSGSSIAADRPGRPPTGSTPAAATAAASSLRWLDNPAAPPVTTRVARRSPTGPAR